jgi:prepilin-type N-terminal cleavage/methylation domain-containing protein
VTRSTLPAKPTLKTVFDDRRGAAAHRAALRAFTLIEIMVVVAIMGLIMAMGVPSILASMKKDGMRKAVSDLQDCCSQARAEAIMQNRTVSLVFHPLEKSFGVDGGGNGASANKVSSSVLPNGIDFAMLDINLMDFGASDVCRARFFPDGTSDEMTIVFHGRDQWKKITLEFSTGIPSVSEVNQ